MVERTTGLILRTRPLTETSLIVHWLTTDFGRISTVAKGARRAKSSFLGKLDLFYLADLSFHPSRRSDLHTLGEVSVSARYDCLRRDLPQLEQAAYFVQLLEQTTEADTPLPGYFDLLRGALESLIQAPARVRTVFAFELKLLSLLGLAPDEGQSKVSLGSRALLSQLGEMDWPELGRIQLSAAQREEIDHFLHRYLIYHLGRIPKGRLPALRPGVEPTDWASSNV